MEKEPKRPKPNYLRSIQSLPDNKFLRREHQVPKVTEKPRPYVVGSNEGVEDNVVYLPLTVQQATQMAIEESINHGYPTGNEPPDLCA